jgi:hypothetical protein
MENQNMSDKKEDDINNTVDLRFVSDLARLWTDTVKEHGRDYDNSKQEIGDFFLTLLGIGTKQISCHYKLGEKVMYYHGNYGWTRATISWIGHEEIQQDFEWSKDENGNSVRKYTSHKYYLPKRIEIELDNYQNDEGKAIKIPLTYYHEDNKPIEIDLEKTHFVMFPKLSPNEIRLTPDERPYNLYVKYRTYKSADHWDSPRNSLRLCKIKRRND